MALSGSLVLPFASCSRAVRCNFFGRARRLNPRLSGGVAQEQPFGIEGGNRKSSERLNSVT